MPSVVKLKANSVQITSTLSNVGGAQCVRIYATADARVSLFANSTASTKKGDVDMNQDDVIFLEKEPSDVINSTAAVNCVSVAFHY